MEWKGKLSIAQELLSGWQIEGFDIDRLVEQIHAAAEDFAEQEQQGHADGLVLLADQINFLEDELVPEAVQAIDHVLNWYLKESTELFPVHSLQSDCWDEPLATEESDALLELLATETSSVDKDIEAEQEGSGELESSNDQSLLNEISSQLSQFDSSDTEWLEEPIEQLSEKGLEGISDLLAMFCSQVAETELDDVDTFTTLFSESIQSFLTSPNNDSLELLLSNLASEYDAEDLEFLEPMLNADLQQLQQVESLVGEEPSAQQEPSAQIEPSADENSDLVILDDIDESDELGESEQQSPVDEPDSNDDGLLESATQSEQDPLPSITIDIDKPDFVHVDLNLLSETQASVDHDVVNMLSQSLQEQAVNWKALDCWPKESVLTSTVMQLGSTSRALETVGLSGARFVVDGLHKNIDWVAAADESIQQAEVSAIASCLESLVAHLNEMSDKSLRETLIDTCSALACGPDIQQAAFINGLLALASVKDPGEIERKVATAEDISLSREKTVDDDLLSMLNNELPQLSDEFSLHLQSIVSDQQAPALLEAQRSAHTIKGLANMAGIRGVANLTHYLEDILELMTDSQLLPNETVGDDMLDAADCLADMCEQVTVGEAQAPENALESLQKIFDWHYKAQTQGVAVLAGAVDLTATAEDDEATIEPSTSSDGESTAASLEAEPEAKSETKAPEVEEQDSQLSVSVGLLNNLFRLAGESTTLNTQLEEELSRLRKMTRMSRDRYRSLERVMADLEQQLHSLNVQQVVADKPEGEFDELEMDRYNELDSTLSRLQESAADVNEVTGSISLHAQQLQELQSQQSGLQKETLDTIIHTRMVPVSTIAGRVQRIVRQAARASGKKVKLKLQGEQVLIDSQILNQLVAPLMHMIRNAVDHGIESPHARFEIGKPEVGVITLSFSRDNDRLLILCEDDGAGVDGDKVRRIAISKGLIDEDVELSENEAQRLILLPGFSTKDEISQLSGRGIGMDVVNLELAKLHGTLHISSELGKGTKMELSLPPSALTVRSLLIRCGQQLMAISTQGIDQSIISIDGRYNEDRSVFTFEDEDYEVKSVESLMGKVVPDYASMSVHPILLVKTGIEEQVALEVNEILAHRELIFKEMSEMIPIIPGISGLTILANGEVAPVVDVPARVRFANSGAEILTEYVPTIAESGLPRVMVVDDSISARQSIVNLLEDLGYEVDSAIDGFDAMNKIRERKPDLVLTDYEMPRVNGVELASALRTTEETADIPIAMITSRSTAKHRNAAEEAGVDRYITKPWTETQLLQALEDLLKEKADQLTF